MKTKEFNLSEMKEKVDIRDMSSQIQDGYETKVFRVEEVKEFIKRLKDEFRKDIIIDDFMVSIKEIDEIIDKLAGSELVGEKNA